MNSIKEEVGQSIAMAIIGVQSTLKPKSRYQLDSIINKLSPERFIHIIEQGLYSIPVEKETRRGAVVDHILLEILAAISMDMICKELGETKEDGKVVDSIESAKFKARFLKPKSARTIQAEVDYIISLHVVPTGNLYKPLVKPAFKTRIENVWKETAASYSTLMTIIYELAVQRPDLLTLSNSKVETRGGNWAHSIIRNKIDVEGKENTMLLDPAETETKLQLNRNSINGVAAQYVSEMKYNLNDKLSKAFTAICNTEGVLEQYMEKAAAKGMIDSVTGGYAEYQRIGSVPFHSQFTQDFRGRLYQMGKISSTKNKMSTAMLRAGEKAPIGKDGYRVILEAIAGSMGLDKKTWTERLSYSKDNLDRFIGLGYQLQIDPVKTMKDLKEMGTDDVWMSMAYCLELSEIDSHVKAGGKVEDFMSDIFCNIDATCSAIGCMSLLTRNIELGQKVNVLSTGKDDVNDIYMEAAQEMVNLSLVEGILEVEHVEALEWFRGLTDKERRKLVKPPFMTDAYGSSTQNKTRKVAELISENLMAPGNKAFEYASAVVMLFNRMLKRIPAYQPLAELKAFFASAAKQYTKNGKAVTWTFPGINGYQPQPMTFKYDQVIGTDHRCLVAGKEIRMSSYGLEVGKAAKRKVVPDHHKPNTSTSPNSVHASDAALLSTIIDLMKGTSLCLIHDSVGCRPDQMTEMKAAIKKAWRLVFIDNDILEAVRGSVPLPSCMGQVTEELVKGLEDSRYSFC